jgi:hypothetical protein
MQEIYFHALVDTHQVKHTNGKQNLVARWVFESVNHKFGIAPAHWGGIMEIQNVSPFPAPPT